MKLTFAALLLLGTILGAIPGWAIVDMKNANYAESWVDVQLPGAGYDLKIERTYNSRSLFNGLFGFGWCSDFETALTQTPEGGLKVVECGGGLEVVYTPRDFSPAALDDVVKSIAAQHRKASPALNDTFYTEFSTNLKSNPRLRSYYADLYKVKRPVQKDQTFYANGREVERIVQKDGLYVRYLADSTAQKFNLQGQLVTMVDRNGNSLKLDYEAGGLLRFITDNSGRKLTLNYGQSKKIKAITGPQNIVLEYLFNGDDLIAAKNAWKNTYKYSYDDLHNLTKIEFPDSTYKALTYNRDRDWVTSFRNRNACLETYDYQMMPDDPQNHYKSEVVKKCDGKVVAQSSYEFWYSLREDGSKFLARVRSAANEDVTDVSYHPVFGRPVSSTQNNQTVKFTYYDNGLVKTRVTERETASYEYENKFRKLSKSHMVFYNEKKKPTHKRETEFQYDTKANMVFAENSDGQKVKLTYDLAGRIATIQDQAKRLVKIQYDPKFNKPAYIERPGVGAITVTYKTSGEIEKVSSKDGPTVAVQVASSFNNLLDIISPATNQQNL